MVDVEDKGNEVAISNKGKELLGLQTSASEAGDKANGLDSNYLPYPEALASYKEVVENKKLFMKSLRELHLATRTKFMIPTVGGKDLDLYQLFIEATSRGGFEKAIRDGRWKEVTCSFNFPSTATNASFILRKHYMTLLHHYEQIYFFRAKGCTIPSAISSCTTSTSISQSVKRIKSTFPFLETSPATHKKRSGEVAHKAIAAVLGPAMQASQTVVCTINGKIEDGYLISAKIGGTKFKGVIFHVSQQNAAFQGVGSCGGDTRVTRRRRRRKRLSSIDPTHPKPGRSGYNFFFAEQHARLRLLNPGKDREISRMIGDLWSNLSEPERTVYQEIGLKDQQRYQSEMVVYRERQRAGPALANVVPIQQPPVGNQELNLPKTDVADGFSGDDSVAEREKSGEDSGIQNSTEEAADLMAFELQRGNLAENGNGTIGSYDFMFRQ